MKSLPLLSATNLLLTVISAHNTTRDLQQSIHTNTQAHIPPEPHQNLFVPTLTFVLGMIVMFTARLLYDRFKPNKSKLEPREI